MASLSIIGKVTSQYIASTVSNINAKVLIQVPSIICSQVRYRRAVAFREYKQPHFRQKLLLAACEPVFPKVQLPTSQKCGHLIPKPVKPHHPYDVLLAADMEQELEQSQLVCLLHQNQMNQSTRRLLSNEFTHEQMCIRYYNRDIAKICMENTKYEPLLRYFAIGYPFTVLFAPDLKKIDKILKILRKYPQVILMGALVEQRRLVTVKQLQELQKTTLKYDLDQQRAQLCNTLTIGQQSLRSILDHHQMELSRLLQSHSQPPEGKN